MGTRKTRTQETLERTMEEAAEELEGLAEEIRLKIHLAGMDANTLWNEKLEPKLFEARVHAREAKEASRAAVEDTIKALRDFSAVL